ncbi:MAG: RsmD family RNA methyltransferase [Bacteroidales bacterium]|nr:RsmD family RNA methyltransferase [Bacteroidales bacterium]MDT8375025.1 RsmD family RNA methyltransferase [Bacteroidales bacterium]
MRIIGGRLKGRFIEPPAGFKARPTTDFAREGLMNILDNRYDFPEISLLDLFGGTGAISYEFASRGTTDIDIIETDRRNCEFIRRTLHSLELTSAKVHRLDVRDWLKICHKQYDIIFADPPYALRWLTELPEMVMRSGAVHDSTLFILEHPKSLNFSGQPYMTEHRKYGNVNFSFFRLSE